MIKEWALFRLSGVETGYVKSTNLLTQTKVIATGMLVSSTGTCRDIQLHQTFILSLKSMCQFHVYLLVFMFVCVCVRIILKAIHICNCSINAGS